MSYTRFNEMLKDYLSFNNISNKEFSTRIGVTPKHLIDILSGESDLSLSVVESISMVTGIPSEYILNVENNYKMEKEINEYLADNGYTINSFLNKFSYKELIKNNWINFSYIDSKITILIDIMKFLRISSLKSLYSLDKNILFKSNNNKPELLMLWLEKCYRESLNQKVSEYKKENIDILVKYISNQAKNNVFDIPSLVNKFNENGIKLVIQEDLPGSKIRGAFKVNRDIPSIYLTKKYKRISDIYFALLHELAHCKTDFNKAKGTNIVLYEFEENTEINADIQAYDWMVNDDYYNNIIFDENYKLTSETNFPKSFIVYRLAKDKIIDYSSDVYQKYNPVIDI